jgi:putative two-component system response regulator
MTPQWGFIRERLVPSGQEAMKVLVVDDDAANLDLIEQLLHEAGYVSVLSTREPQAVADICSAWKPDLLLLDLHMPELDGFAVMAQIRMLMEDPENLPVVVLTADATPEARHQALAMGARDFITKPVDGRELLLRTRNMLHTRELQLQLQLHNASLEESVRQRTLDLEAARLESLTLLAAVGEFHDDDTYRHTQRVGSLAASLARGLGMSETICADIRAAAPLHDLGKVGVPREILRKPGPLTGPEREVMMRHAAIGAQILAPSTSPALQLAAVIARSHHERWDGTGYPDRIRAAEIPIAARITAVADVFDALTHDRPYKAAWEIAAAVELVADESGRQFDPDVAAAFAALDPGVQLAVVLER